MALALGYVLLALEGGLHDLLALGSARLVPSLITALVVFVVLHAPPVSAMWFALLAGLAVDLLSPLGPGASPVPGPQALGMLAGAYFVLTVRGVMIRRNPLTVVALTLLAAGLAQLVVCTLLTLRAMAGHLSGWDPGAQMLLRMGAALYTAAAALPVALILGQVHHWFGFPGAHGRHSSAAGPRRR